MRFNPSYLPFLLEVFYQDLNAGRSSRFGKTPRWETGNRSRGIDLSNLWYEYTVIPSCHSLSPTFHLNDQGWQRPSQRRRCNELSHFKCSAGTTLPPARNIDCPWRRNQDNVETLFLPPKLQTSGKNLHQQHLSIQASATSHFYRPRTENDSCAIQEDL
jgi:hypothetical protein